MDHYEALAAEMENGPEVLQITAKLGSNKFSVMEVFTDTIELLKRF